MFLSSSLFLSLSSSFFLSLLLFPSLFFYLSSSLFLSRPFSSSFSPSCFLFLSLPLYSSCFLSLSCSFILSSLSFYHFFPFTISLSLLLSFVLSYTIISRLLSLTLSCFSLFFLLLLFVSLFLLLLHSCPLHYYLTLSINLVSSLILKFCIPSLFEPHSKTMRLNLIAALTHYNSLCQPVAWFCTIGFGSFCLSLDV